MRTLVESSRSSPDRRSLILTTWIVINPIGHHNCQQLESHNR
jgi:hypothetical protein